MKTFPKSVRGFLLLGCVFSVVIGLNAPASAALLFTENFSDNSPNPNMALGTGYTHLANPGPPTTSFAGGNFTITSGDFNRIYLGTNDTDYSSIDFIFSATVTMSSSTSAWGYFFMGMGSRDATGASGEPGNPRILGAIDPGNFFRGRDDNTPSQVSTADPSPGTHRMRLTWNATTKQGLFELDLAYTGTFTADYNFTLNGADNGFTSSNSRLLVGGGNGLIIDDISVTSPVAAPEPSSFALIIGGAFGLFGIARRRVSKKA